MTVSPPDRTGPDPPPPSPSRESDLRPPSGRAPDGYTRALRWGLAISVVAHLLVLLGYPVWLRWTDPTHGLPPGEAVSVPATPSSALEVIVLREVDDDDEVEAMEPEVPTEPVPEAPPGALDGPPTPPVEPPVEGRPGRTAAEQIQPRLVDPRIWQGIDPELTRLSEEERALLRLHALFRAVNDSAALAEEEARRATDWTTTDEDGNRWGVSPGQIHLGRFSMPLPFHFTSPPGRREDAERRAWEWDQIERGAAAAGARQNWNERAREIRERRDLERQDTTGIRN